MGNRTLWMLSLGAAVSVALPIHAVMARSTDAKSSLALPSGPSFDRPDNVTFTIEAGYRGQSLSEALLGSGAKPADVESAVKAFSREAIQGWATGASIKVAFADRGNQRIISFVEIHALDATHRVEHHGGEFVRLPSHVVALEQLRADDKQDLYWRLRGRGVAASDVERLARDMNETLPLVAIVKNSELSSRPALIGLAQLDGDQLVRIASTTADHSPSSGVGEVVSGRISSSFGHRRHPILGYLRFHDGLDIAAPSGTPVRAAADGVVRKAGWAGGYGKRVELSHGVSDASRYGHLSAMAVRAGDHVRKGQVIGFVGSTGFSTGPHLHYEWRRNGEAVDPTGIVLQTSASSPKDQTAQKREFARWLLLAEPA